MLLSGCAQLVQSPRDIIKIMNKRGFSAFAVIVLIIVVVLIVTIGIWYYKMKASSLFQAPSQNISAIANTTTTTKQGVSSTTSKTPLTLANIDMSTWKVYGSGLFKYPPNWSAVDITHLGTSTSAWLAPEGHPVPTIGVIIGSGGCRPAPSFATSSVVISGKTVMRIDEQNGIIICENTTSTDGTVGGRNFLFMFNSTTTRVIDEAIISTFNLNQ